MYYSVLWERLAGGTQEFVENYFLSQSENNSGFIKIEPTYPVDYKIKNLDKIVNFNSADNYFVHKIAECRNINDLSTELKELVSQYLPKFFSKYPEYKDEKCLKIEN